MKTARKVLILLLSACLLLSGCSAAKNNQNTLGAGSASQTASVTSPISRDEKFGSAKIPMTADQFAKEGFQLGDSVDILFSNGYEMTDVPYYNGYYVKNGAPVLVAYPGFDYLAITYNNMGIWDTAELQADDSVTVSLNQSGKYLPIQEALGQSYSFDRTDYESDEQFCNFRAMSGGNLKPDYLYRGASPVDNSRGRAPYTDGLLEAAGIGYVIDLADSAEDMTAYQAAEDFVSDYTASLYEQGHMILLDMSSSFQSEEYHQKVAEGLKLMLGCEGSVYLHCMEGKDRTGFVSMLLEALAGASYDEMVADYMITYDNYFRVSPDKDQEKYDAIAELYFDAFVSYLHGTEDIAELKAADYSADAAAYLLEGGMTQDEIDQLLDQITVSP